MDLIVTHSNADFDALASLVAAKKIYPGAEITFSTSVERNVRDFLNSYPQFVSLKKPKRIDPKKVSRLVLVDTRLGSRIGPFKNLLMRPDLPLHIYDHHPAQEGDLEGCENYISGIGATVTILIEEIRRRRIKITPLEATLFAMGIYEDTGCLLFPTTSIRDVEALGYLLKKGADLNEVSKYIHQKLDIDQIRLLSVLLRSQTIFSIHGVRVSIASAEVSDYVMDLAVLAHKIMDFQDIDALFLMVGYRGRVQVVSRSRSSRVNVGDVLGKLNGGGHATAASGILKGKNIKSAKEEIINCLSTSILLPEEVVKVERKDLVSGQVPKRIRKAIEVITDIARKMEVPCYLVGGFVRDLLLKRENFDIDVVIEGDGIQFGLEVSKRLKGVLKKYDKFLTSTIIIEDDFKIDVTTARSEIYEQSGALPIVIRSSLKQDLFRRDFTINSIAFELNPNFGVLHDYFRGLKALEMGKIEVLHPLSFKDDPTRIFRAIRFSERFSFEIEARTKSLMMEALAEGDLSNISRQRIRDEFILTLEESDPFKPIERLSKLNLLKYAHPELRINSNTEELYKQILSYYFQFGLVLFDKVIVRWLPFFLGLLEHLNFSQTEEVLKTLNFPKALRNKVLSCKLKDDDVVSILKRPHKLPPSVIHQKLKGFSTEALLFLAAKAEVMMVDAKSDLVKKRLSQFLQDLRRAKVSITGHDLKRIGFKPGPVYKKIIDALLLGRLDGLIKSREDELRCVEEFKQRL